MEKKKIKVSVRHQVLDVNRDRGWILRELDKYPKYDPKKDPAIKRLNERFAEIEHEYSNRGCLGTVIFAIMVAVGLPSLYLLMS